MTGSAGKLFAELGDQRLSMSDRMAKRMMKCRCLNRITDLLIRKSYTSTLFPLKEWVG